MQFINYAVYFIVCVPVFYFLFFSLASLFYRQKKYDIKLATKRRITVIIPAYQEDAVILKSAESTLKHESILAELHVLIIADGLQAATIASLRESGAQVEEIKNEKGTKAAALEFAMQFLPERTDEIIILDIDNVMKEGFVDQILSTKIAESLSIVQEHRTAKNINTPYAILDAVSEEINNSIFRRGHRVVGLSSALIGSGFICDVSLFEEYFVGQVNSRGEDKEFELKLFEHRKVIGYDNSAIVYDEKVERPGVFYLQRKRWMAIQRDMQQSELIRFVRKPSLYRNPDYLNKLYQLNIPPKMLLIGIVIVGTMTSGILHLCVNNDGMLAIKACWLLLALSLIVIVLSAIRFCKINLIMLLKATIHLPNMFILMIIARLNLNKQRNEFIHTKHSAD